MMKKIKFLVRANRIKDADLLRFRGIVLAKEAVTKDMQEVQ